MGLKIGANDLEIKLRKIRTFLHDGHKVKIFIFFNVSQGTEWTEKKCICRNLWNEGLEWVFLITCNQ